MTSVLNVDTIADKAGSGPVGLTKQIASKHFLNYDFVSDTIHGSFNQSSLTDHGTGSFSTNFTNNFSSIGYAPAGVGSFARLVLTYATSNNNSTEASTTGLFKGKVTVAQASHYNFDASPCSVVITGDLA